MTDTKVERELLAIAARAAQKLWVEYGRKTVSHRHEYDQLIAVREELRTYLKREEK